MKALRIIKVIGFIILSLVVCVVSAWLQNSQIIINPTYYVVYGNITGVILTLLLIDIVVQPSFRCRRKQQTNYTLIEILMVIVIMSMLMAIAMPGFISMVKGTGVVATQRNLAQSFKLARTHAICNREYVAVLMPQSCKDASGAYYPALIPDKYYDRSYRTCIVDSNKQFKRWLDGENWEYLPIGVAILEVDNDTAAIPPHNDSVTVIDNVDFSDIGVSGRVDNVAGIIFRPNGKALNSYVSIGEGVYSNGYLQLTSKGYVSIVTDRFTGRITCQ